MVHNELNNQIVKLKKSLMNKIVVGIINSMLELFSYFYEFSILRISSEIPEPFQY